LGWQVRRWLGSAVECVDAEGEEHTVGLENLYRRTRREEREHWPAFIADFLSKIRTAEQNISVPADLGTVAEQLMVRLGRTFASLTPEVQIWSQPLPGTDLQISRVIDQPETMSYVTEQMVADSGRPGSDWLEQALDNLEARTPEDCFERVHEESGMLLCSIGDAYDSSRALLLDVLLPEDRAAGVLAAIPSRDELLVLPVDGKALPHLHLLKVLAEKSYQNAPYPISDDVFWIHDGIWHLFPIEIRSDKVTIKAPEAFLDWLKHITNETEPEDPAPEESC
jgi:hypothetical protein